ncbi:uncharacterized protein BX664DRAFT_319158 [Halteromyces radiatus]|uniref:uncharacterized protein n=1 Tax=Halteromyces radiatus TaxID=101107 RepID=UPI00222066F4|nr:uncharacterized protein BX664DRAFT_319158 [Halteromyces radiatus]KAI8098611.1 hypothetical protein BX664DRAFT_319158 [Halteromyces radiatus]
MLLSPLRSVTTTTRTLARSLVYTRASIYSSNITLNRFTTQNIIRQFNQYTRDNRPDEYELRIGYAITVLQDELPRFFDQGLQVQDIYSQQVVLSDPHYTRLSIKGKTAYIGIAEMLRWSLGCYFDSMNLEIIRMRVLPDRPNGDDITSSSSPPSSPSSSSSCSYITSFRHQQISSNPWSLHLLSKPMEDGSYQRHHHSRPYASVANNIMSSHIRSLEDGLSLSSSVLPTSSSLLSSSVSTNRPSSNVRSLEIRWQLQAKPHSFFFQRQAASKIHQVEGVFIYTFDQQGYICEHKIQRIEPSPSRRILLMHSYGGRLRAFLEALKRRSEPELRPGLG